MHGITSHARRRGAADAGRRADRARSALRPGGGPPPPPPAASPWSNLP